MVMKSRKMRGVAHVTRMINANGIFVGRKTIGRPRSRWKYIL